MADRRDTSIGVTDCSRADEREDSDRLQCGCSGGGWQGESTMSNMRGVPDKLFLKSNAYFKCVKCLNVDTSAAYLLFPMSSQGSNNDRYIGQTSVSFKL